MISLIKSFKGVLKRIILFFTRTKIYHFLSKRLRFSNRPVSPFFGGERGLPIDRYYIDKFLLANKEDIKGRCLEVEDREYISRFGQDTECLDVLCPVQIGVVNVVANLDGLAAEELSAKDLGFVDERFPVIFGVRVVKS